MCIDSDILIYHAGYPVITGALVFGAGWNLVLVAPVVLIGWAVVVFAGGEWIRHRREQSAEEID